MKFGAVCSCLINQACECLSRRILKLEYSHRIATALSKAFHFATGGAKTLVVEDLTHPAFARSSIKNSIEHAIEKDNAEHPEGEQ